MITETLTQLLSELGFKKRSGLIFTIGFNQDVIGWLGLNCSTRHRATGEIEINPVIGVRHQAVERLVAESRGEKFHGYQPPTVSTPLGYLLPEARYRSWLFNKSEFGNQARDLVSMVELYGFPFMRSMVDLSSLCEAMELKTGFDHQLAYRRPVAFFLSGFLDQAKNDLQETMRSIGSREDLAASEFRKFAEKLQRQHFG